MPQHAVPLEPSPEEHAALIDAAARYAVEFHRLQADATTTYPPPDPDLLAAMAAPPGEEPWPGGMDALLELVARSTVPAFATTSPGYLAYIPGGGIPSAAVGDLLACATNRFVNLAAAAPAFVAAEDGVLAWLADVFGVPGPADGGGGLLTSGGSLSLFSAVVCARHDRLGEDRILDGAWYCSEHTHHAVEKASRLAGIPKRALRTIPCGPDLRMDVDALRTAVREDRAAGKVPFLVIGNAGTTNTGVIDPLPAIADLARDEELWFHADGAYGGVFQLTSRGRERLAGIERADSITLDPHKGLFLPYGTGCLLVRRAAVLEAAHGGEAHYLQDATGTGFELPDFSSRSPELSRDNRGLRVWLPLRLHGVAAFRQALDEKLDLTVELTGRLRKIEGIEVPWEPDLTVVAFRSTRGDEDSRRIMESVNRAGRVYLSSTVVDGRFVVRACILSYRTHADRIDDLVNAVELAVAGA